MTRISVPLAAVGFGVAALLTFPSVAQTPNPTVWQNVITGQIEAFRNDDGETALSLAGSGFKTNYPDPAMFLAWVEQSGYGPIVDSIRHSFRGYEVAANGVVTQDVMIIGPDLNLYTATYQLFPEAGGFRVYGVVLSEVDGIAI